MNLKTAHCISSIQILFRHNEDLITFFFDHKHPTLRLAVEDLIEESQVLGPSESLLIQVAVDFWNETDHVKLFDVIGKMSDEDLLSLIGAVLHFREIEYVLEGVC